MNSDAACEEHDLDAELLDRYTLLGHDDRETAAEYGSFKKRREDLHGELREKAIDKAIRIARRLESGDQETLYEILRTLVDCIDFFIERTASFESAAELLRKEWVAALRDLNDLGAIVSRCRLEPPPGLGKPRLRIVK
jgi:hypothetical protein